MLGGDFILRSGTFEIFIISFLGSSKQFQAVLVALSKIMVYKRAVSQNMISTTGRTLWILMNLNKSSNNSNPCLQGNLKINSSLALFLKQDF